MYTIDTETALIEQGRLAPPVTCLQFAVDDGPVMVAVVGVDPVEEIARAIFRSELVVGHNVAYDLLCLVTEYPSLWPDLIALFEAQRVACTIVREKLRLIAKGRLKGARFSLAELAKKYGGVKNPDDPWRLRYAELRGVPFQNWPGDAKVYASHDVEETRRVFHGQGRDLPDEGPQTRAAFTLHCIGAAGVHTDPVQVAAFEAVVNDQYDTDALTLKAHDLVRPNGTKDTKAAKARMVQVLTAQGFEAPKTPTGQPKMDEETCVLSGDAVLLAYQRYGSMRNLRTRLQGLKKGTAGKPLNSRFDSLVSTGRTSCSQGEYGYQLQNMRRIKGERECFIPRPGSGHVFLASDYDGFELCTLAQVLLWTVGWSTLADALRSGLDAHVDMARKILGIPYDQALARYKAGDEEVSRARQMSKAANFGYPGGMGPATFRKKAKSEGVDMSEDEAYQLREDWLSSWPEMRQYFAWINSHEWREIVRGKNLRQVTTAIQLGSGRVRGGCTYCEACNTQFQGLASCAAKAAGWELVKACAPGGELEGWKVWNFIHDEFILEGPRLDGHRAGLVVKRLMETAAQALVPDVPITASPALMERWSKKAKPIYVDGILVPWKG